MIKEPAIPPAPADIGSLLLVYCSLDARECNIGHTLHHNSLCFELQLEFRFLLAGSCSPRPRRTHTQDDERPDCISFSFISVCLSYAEALRFLIFFFELAGSRFIRLLKIGHQCCYSLFQPSLLSEILSLRRAGLFPLIK